MLNVFFMYPQIANFKYSKNNMIQLFGFLFLTRELIFLSFFNLAKSSKNLSENNPN